MGRSVLVGDAAYCASPLSGMGTGMAVVGAYVLAGELTLGAMPSGRTFWPRRVFKQRGVTVHEINRGGDVTYHGPGQLVGYTIFDLRTLRTEGGGRMGPVDFVRGMEEALIRLCGEFGVSAGSICGLTGVWCVADGGALEESE